MSKHKDNKVKAQKTSDVIIEDVSSSYYRVIFDPVDIVIPEDATSQLTQDILESTKGVIYCSMWLAEGGIIDVHVNTSARRHRKLLKRAVHRILKVIDRFTPSIHDKKSAASISEPASPDQGTAQTSGKPISDATTQNKPTLDRLAQDKSTSDGPAQGKSTPNELASNAPTLGNPPPETSSSKMLNDEYFEDDEERALHELFKSYHEAHGDEDYYLDDLDEPSAPAVDMGANI